MELMAVASWMVAAVVVVCLVAGLATVAFACVALSLDERIEEKIESTVEKLNAEAASDLGSQEGESLDGTTTQQVSVLTGGSEYVRAITELAGSLSRVSQAPAEVRGGDEQAEFILAAYPTRVIDTSYRIGPE